MAAVGTALLALNQGESAHRVYSDKSIEQITSENPPAETADESGNGEGAPSYGAQSEV